MSLSLSDTPRETDMSLSLSATPGETDMGLSLSDTPGKTDMGLSLSDISSRSLPRACQFLTYNQRSIAKVYQCLTHQGSLTRAY